MVVVSRTFYALTHLRMREGAQVLRLSHSVSWHLCLGNVENFSGRGTESLGPVSSQSSALSPCKAEFRPWGRGLRAC